MKDKPRRNAHIVPFETRHPFEPVIALVLDAVDSPHTRAAPTAAP